jgi:hypothetical protein
MMYFNSPTRWAGFTKSSQGSQGCQAKTMKSQSLITNDIQYLWLEVSIGMFYGMVGGQYSSAYMSKNGSDEEKGSLFFPLSTSLRQCTSLSLFRPSNSIHPPSVTHIPSSLFCPKILVEHRKREKPSEQQRVFSFRLRLPFHEAY